MKINTQTSKESGLERNIPVNDRAEVYEVFNNPWETLDGMLELVKHPGELYPLESKNNPNTPDVLDLGCRGENKDFAAVGNVYMPTETSRTEPKRAKADLSQGLRFLEVNAANLCGGGYPGGESDITKRAQLQDESYQNHDKYFKFVVESMKSGINVLAICDLPNHPELYKRLAAENIFIASIATMTHHHDENNVAYHPNQELQICIDADAIELDLSNTSIYTIPHYQGKDMKNNGFADWRQNSPKNDPSKQSNSIFLGESLVVDAITKDGDNLILSSIYNCAVSNAWQRTENAKAVAAQISELSKKNKSKVKGVQIMIAGGDLNIQGEDVDQTQRFFGIAPMYPIGLGVLSTSYFLKRKNYTSRREEVGVGIDLIKLRNPWLINDTINGNHKETVFAPVPKIGPLLKPFKRNIVGVTTDGILIPSNEEITALGYEEVTFTDHLATIVEVNERNSKFSYADLNAIRIDLEKEYKKLTILDKSPEVAAALVVFAGTVILKAVRGF